MTIYVDDRVHLLDSSTCFCEPVPAEPCPICGDPDQAAPRTVSFNDFSACTYCNGARYIPYVDSDVIFYLHSDEFGLNLFNYARLWAEGEHDDA